MSNPDVPSIRLILGIAAAGSGELILANADTVAVPPKGKEGSPYVGLFEALLVSARAIQARLVVALPVLEAAEAAHSGKVKAARKAERTLKRACSALHARVQAEIKADTVGAAEIDERCFPDGLAPLIRPSGRSLVASVLAWLPVLSDESVTSNPAYALIADKAIALRDLAAAFTATIQEKDRLETALDLARAERNAAQTEWTSDFRNLLDAGARLHGEDSAVFRGWVRPVLDWKANQDALKTRQANAQAAAATPTETPIDAPPEGDEGS